MLTRGKYAENSQFFPAAKGYPLLSRIQNILLSAAALVLLAPLMGILAAVIFLDDPSASPIFTQTRVGRHGKNFTLYKFRTMHPGAENQLDSLLSRNEMDGPAFKLRQDPRLTRVGKWLRRTNLDELPQFWNVLKGEMSIVGPRPALPRETALYTAQDRIRLTVLPGMTCYWQIQPRHQRLNFRQWMALDQKYIREQSLLTDWRIMAATFGALLRMDGM